MSGFNPKKLAIVRIIDILKNKTSEDYPLTQEQISEILYNEYDIELKRKAIADDLDLLEDCEYDIIHTNKGVYLASNVFDKTELRVLIDCILCSRYLSEKQSKELIGKLVEFGGKDYKSHVKHIHSIDAWQKTDNKAVLYNIDCIDRAIEEGKKVLIKYGRRGVDKKLEMTYPQLVSPYSMLLHNQRYYLAGYNNHYHEMTFLKIDKMLEVKILDEPLTPIKDAQGTPTLDYKDLACARPYMYTDKAIDITLKCDKKFLDDIYDWFGFNVFVKPINNTNEVKVVVKSSPDAMVYWAMQYGDHIQVVSPDEMRNRIIEKIKEVNTKYGL